MACSNCSCKSNPEKDREDTVPGTTKNGDIYLSKHVNKELFNDLANEIKAIHRFLRLKFPELKNGAILWSHKKDVDEQALQNREWQIQDLRSQGYLVEAPQTAPTRTTGYTEE